MLFVELQRVAHLRKTIVAVIDSLDLRTGAAHMVQDRLGDVDGDAKTAHRRRKISAKVVKHEVIDAAELVELRLVFSPRAEGLTGGSREEIL